MIKKVFDIKSAKQLHFIAIIAALVLAIIVIAIDVVCYSRYRSALIHTEQGQLLTMARIIGVGLDEFLEEEIGKIDLCFDDLEIGGFNSVEAVRQMSERVMEYSKPLYLGCTCIQGEQEVFRIGSLQKETGEMALPVSQKTAILGKYLGTSGWYEMLIGKRVVVNGSNFQLIFNMDLNCVYQKIVSPVKIGQGGYSVVKDHDLAIIMHHAKNQIGMDALYDREEKYPQLDLSSLTAWLELQRSEREGTSILDSYVWDDPALSPIRRIVAYTTIDIQGEQWIVNSTLPISELSNPLRNMILVMATLTLLYLSVMFLMLNTVNRMLLRNVAQKQEIEYMKEINRGMELIARQNQEIRHYQRVQSLGMMSSHIAHEFNNYLTPVMLYGEMLEADESVSEENRAILHEMLKSVGQASQLSRDLLDFSRMDAGGRFQPLNLTDEMSEAVSIVRQLVPRKIIFAAKLSDTPAWLVGRAGMMQHILMNLCKNALQAMENTKEKRLSVTYQVYEDHVRLTVSDSGCGIRDEDLKRIFEPYYTTKGSSQGTGLGLSVVRSLVEQAHGSIEVESGTGKGTTFCMKLPTVASRQMLQIRGQRGQFNKALCVCRQKQDLEPWQAWLENINDRLEYLSSEPAAVARLKQEPVAFDLLVIQQDLASMRGVEFAHIVRSGNIHMRIVVLVDHITDSLKWYLDNGIVDELIPAGGLEKTIIMETSHG